MDEMTQLRELRSATPPITPDAAEAARNLLLAEAGATGRPLAAAAGPAVRPRPFWARPAWRAGAVAAVAAAAAAVTAVAMTGGSGGGTGNGPKNFAPVANVKELGTRAAKAAETGTAVAPGQWTYIKTMDAGSTYGSTRITGKRSTSERWAKYNGRAHDVQREGRTVRMPPDPEWANLGRYSTNPNVLIGQLENRSLFKNPPDFAAPWQGPDTAAFLLVRSLMDYGAPSPKLQAAFYRVLPRLKGVTLERNVADAAGRRGIAFALAVNGGGQREEIILNPKTYAYMGHRTVSLTPQVEYPDRGQGKRLDNWRPKPTGTAPAGTVTSLSAQLVKAPVAKEGERP
ncbi:CU044_5270 family protein [Actinomadura sp. NTSP31]|uniref:CU044_5270 family protein n=1 Tax=Actinomadura sp. NTSP31 TaxID=1735447 RepID=UPI0035C22BB1